MGTSIHQNFYRPVGTVSSQEQPIDVGFSGLSTKTPAYIAINSNTYLSGFNPTGFISQGKYALNVFIGDTEEHWLLRPVVNGDTAFSGALIINQINTGYCFVRTL